MPKKARRKVWKDGHRLPLPLPLPLPLTQRVKKEVVQIFANVLDHPLESSGRTPRYFGNAY